MTWNKIFEKYNLIYMYREIFYKLDWRKPNISKVREFLKDCLNISYQLHSENKIPIFKGSQDKKIIQILRWLHDNITYKRDYQIHNVDEYWQYPNETLELKTGDCEDGAILIYCIARINKINPLQIKLVTGDVDGGGHCWIEYVPDEFYDYKDYKINWYTIDWCYYYDSKDFKYRIPKSKKYIKDWWSLSIL